MPWIEKLSEPIELRRCIRDLVALSTLPALWTRYRPKEIADSLAQALLTILNADFVYIALPVDRGELMIEAAYAAGGEAGPETVRAIAQLVTPICAQGSGGRHEIPNPFGAGTARIACATTGIGKAILVGGSVRDGYPTEAQRLLLNIAGNEAAIALQQCDAEAEERRFIALVERSSDFIAYSDLSGRPQYVNPAGLSLVGLTIADLSPLKVADFVVPAERRRLQEECWPKALQERRWTGELNFRNFRTGEEIPFFVDAFRIDHPRSGRPMNIATVSRDLRKQKHAEMELRRLNASLEHSVESRTADLVVEIAQRRRADARSQELQFALSHAGRLSAAGQMAAALAHELSQPLAAVTNSANAARRLLAQSGREQMEVVGDILSEIAEQSLRAGQIMHRLRDFVTRGESEKRVENVKTLIHEASAFARIGLDLPDVRLHVAIEPEATCVFVNRIQIQQVLVNLMRNAFEAVADIQHPELHIATSSMSGDGGMIEVLVVDNGPGLSSDIADRLFEPFVSTRPDGMGLGLAISRSIVEAHGGRLCYAPSLDRGSVFRFTLPSAGPSRQGYGQ